MLYSKLNPVTAAVFLFTCLIGELTFYNDVGFAAFLFAGNHTITLKQADRERSAIVHVPPRAAEGRDLAVVMNFHGGGGPRRQRAGLFVDGPARRS